MKINMCFLFCSKLAATISFMALSLISVAAWASSEPLDPVQNKQVTLVTESWGWYMGADLPQQGFLTAVVQEAFTEMGYEFKVEFLPWSRAIEMVRRGERAGLLGAYYSEERAQTLYYSNEIAAEQEVLFAKRDANIDLRQPNGIANYRLGVVRDALHGDLFFDGNNLNKIETTSRDQLIQMLMSNRIDLFAGPKSVIKHMIATQFPEFKGDIVALRPELVKTPIYVGFSRNIKNYERLQADFNQGLKQLRESGRYDELRAQAVRAN